MLRKLAGPLQCLILTYISTTEGLDDGRQETAWPITWRGGAWHMGARVVVHGVGGCVQRLDVRLREIVWRRIGPRKHADLPGATRLGVRRPPRRRHSQAWRSCGRSAQRQEIARFECAALPQIGRLVSA